MQPRNDEPGPSPTDPIGSDRLEQELQSWLSDHDDVDPGFEDEFRSALYAAFDAIPGVDAPARGDAERGTDSLLASAYFGIATARMLVAAERAANVIRETSSPIHPQYDRLRSIADDLDARRRALEFGLRALTGDPGPPSTRPPSS